MGKIALAHHVRLAKRAIKYARTEFEITVPKRLRDEAEAELTWKILDYMQEHGIILFDESQDGLLVSVAAGHLANWLRKQQRRQCDEYDDRNHSDNSGYVEAALGEMDEQLTSDERDILQLKTERGLTQEQIQSELGLTEYKVSQAFKRFKELLDL